MPPNFTVQPRLECYGAGYALLEPEESRYVITDQGRRALAMAWLFDRGPTVAELDHADVRRHLERVHADLISERLASA